VVPELSHFDLRKLPFRSLPAKRGLKVKAPISIRAGQAELEKKKRKFFPSQQTKAISRAFWSL